MAVILGAAMIAVSAEAEPGGGGRGRGCDPSFDRQCGLINAALGLDDKQEAQVRAILEKRRDQMEKTRGSCLEMGKALREEADREIRAILTAEQRKLFGEMRDRRGRQARKKDGPGKVGAAGQAGRRAGIHGGKGGGICGTEWGEGKGAKVLDRHIERLARRLDLTSAQKQKVKAVFEGKTEKMERIRAECAPGCRKVREATDKEIRAVLTPEQVTIFDRIQAARGKTGDAGCGMGPGRDRDSDHGPEGDQEGE